MDKTHYGHEKDQCNCLGCTIRRVVERKNEEAAAKIFKTEQPKSYKREAWMELLDEEQLVETIEDAAKVDCAPSADIAILTLTHALKQYGMFAKLAKDITDAVGAKDAPEFAKDKRAKLRKQLHSLIDLL